MLRSTGRPRDGRPGSPHESLNCSPLQLLYVDSRVVICTAFTAK